MRRAFATLAAGLGALGLLTVPAAASKCIGFASAPAPGIKLVSLGPTIPIENEVGPVRITFVTHSTFRIETPAGTTIATDYAGFAGGVVPTVVTMNKAHETHYTDFPDPAIEHVLRGWNPAGGAARHDLRIGGLYIRNVPTDIRTWSGEREKDANSIFIFEVADLCIGHLGHLHHELAPAQIAQIGQLDIVMVPVDGTFTMAHENMAGVMQELSARIVLPMHIFGRGSLLRFLAAMRDDFEIVTPEVREITVSRDTLPADPQVIVLQPGLAESFGDD